MVRVWARINVVFTFVASSVTVKKLLEFPLSAAGSIFKLFLKNSNGELSASTKKLH